MWFKVMVCGPVCGRSRRREVEDEEEEGWKPKLRTPGRQPFPHKCSLLWVWVAVSFSKVPYDNALATLAQASACSGNGLGEGEASPGFCATRVLQGPGPGSSTGRGQSADRSCTLVLPFPLDIGDSKFYVQCELYYHTLLDSLTNYVFSFKSLG